MLYPADLLKEVISGLDIKINIYLVVVDGSTFKCYAENTYWFYPGETITLNSIKYKVVSFEINNHLLLSGSVLPVAGEHQLINPTFKHGKLKPTKEEIARDPDILNYYPLIWMFESSPRGSVSEVDTALESTGAVRLFVMNISSYSDFTTGDHYINVINPLSSLVDLLIKALKKHRRTGKIFVNTNLPHAKFTNDSGDTDSEGNNILTEELSGIELDLDLPIRIDLNCVPRFFPA